MGWGNSECKGTKNTTKRALSAIKGLNKKESCRPIFKELQILTVITLYIFEVLCYSKKKKNKIYLKRNLDMYEYNMRR